MFRSSSLAGAVVLLMLSCPALAQVPPLPGEERMEEALAAAETAMRHHDWATAAARFAEARAALPTALPPLLGLARANEGLARPLEAAAWYRTYLAAALDPDEDERLGLCRRTTALRAAHDKRTAQALSLADKVVTAAETLVATAPPPEGSTRTVEMTRLQPARDRLARAKAERHASPPPPANIRDLEQGIGIGEAWAALTIGSDWREMEQSFRALGRREVKHQAKAEAAASLAHLHVALAARYDALARLSDRAGRGCQ